MATLGIDGLASGLNTTTLIDGLMQLEAAPQTHLKSKQTQTQSLVSALQSLNLKVASLAEGAKTAATAQSWSAWKATSSSASATATASTSAQAGTVTFTVDKVATTQVSVTDLITDDGSIAGIPPQITVQVGLKLVTIEPTTGSLADVTEAINEAADAGVKATLVRVSGGETPTYRIQFTGTTTGEDGAFTIYRGSAAEVGAGTAVEIAATDVRVAQNAQITLWQGIAGVENTISQSSNTFVGLMTGVDVTIAKPTAADEDPVTITVGRDTAALTTLAKNLVSGLNTVVSEIASRTKVATATSGGAVSVTAGVLTGDSAVRDLSDRIARAASYPVDGRSPAELGIVIGKDGTFTFDQEKFAAALEADPARVQSAMTVIAERVAAVATAASDPDEGSLTLKIQGQEGLLKTYGTQIEEWDRRLAVRKASLERTYAALEVTLDKLQAQQSWLTSQIAGLPSWNTSRNS